MVDKYRKTFRRQIEQRCFERRSTKRRGKEIGAKPEKRSGNERRKSNQRTKNRRAGIDRRNK